MKIHTTNYYNTFILIADDAPTQMGQVPPQKGENKTAANLQFELIAANPYKYTSDDVLFQVYVVKNEITPSEYEAARGEFFSKGQACLRASPLTKRYGWGVHHNHEGKIALHSSDSKEYQEFMQDENIVKWKAMKSKK